MNIALIAHTAKREIMVQFCTAYLGILRKHDLCATDSIGKWIAEETGLMVEQYAEGSYGMEQIAARVSYNEIDLLLFFRDPMDDNSSSQAEMDLLRACDMHSIPMATNIATAEVLIHGLDNGDMAWREIVKGTLNGQADKE